MTRIVKRLAWMLAAAAAVACSTASVAAADPVVFAAGDIACDPTDSAFNGGLGTATRCRQLDTSKLTAGATAVLALGDLQYNSASLSNFQKSYNLSWGAFKALTLPVIGNHEGTSTTGGTGFCAYFGAAAHCNASGRQGGAVFYSVDVGTWHVVVLNSNCAAAGGCDVGSPQYKWLAADLASHPRACTLAAWHHPRWSTGHDGSNAFMQPIWKLLYDNGADLVLAGHSHDYERFAPIDGDGVVAAGGMRSFVVGTGGAFFTGLGSTPAPGSQLRSNKAFGVLRLDLHATSYDWKFLPASGMTLSDSGTQACRGAGTSQPDTQPPTRPAALTATAADATHVNLSWTAATDNVGVARYDVERAPSGGTFAALGSAPGTTFTDATAAAGQSYDYRVTAVDAAGNRSPASSTASVTTPAAPPPGGGTILGPFRAVADASVKQASATTNFGTSSNLNSDSGTGVAMESYLRFTVSGVSGRAVAAAKLRLYVNSDGTAAGPGVFGCVVAACAAWSETALTWATRPARAGAATATVGAIAAPTWVEWDVTPLISGDGTYTLVVGPTPTTDGVVFRSDEASSGRPELVVTVG